LVHPALREKYAVSAACAAAERGWQADFQISKSSTATPPYANQLRRIRHSSEKPIVSPISELARHWDFPGTPRWQVPRRFVPQQRDAVQQTWNLGYENPG